MDPNKKSTGRKPFVIIVNGREKEWANHKISFREVVVLAFGTYEENLLISYTVTYKQAEPQRKEGSMVDGDEIAAHPGMIFNVSKTDRS